MTARFNRAWAKASRANLAASVGLRLALSASRSGSAAPATLEQRRDGTLAAYCLCSGKIPNVRAITSLLRRQKACLSTAVYEP